MPGRSGEMHPSRQNTTSEISWDFSKIPVSTRGALEPLQESPRVSAHLPIQAKLKIGALNDPLEHEADRVASLVMAGSDVPIGTAQQPKLRAGATGDPLEPARATVPPDSFRGRGEPLPAPVRGPLEHRLHYDFTGVRVHHGPDAAESARSLGARAYTYGRDIVFGAGEYSPSSGQGRKLLAHELAHVKQQGASQPLVQRSALSDALKAAWTASPRIETLLARLSQKDVQGAQGDKDIDTELEAILKDRPDDLWVAQRIRMGKLGDTTGQFGPKEAGQPVARPIEACFFQGSTDRRALVIAGVHGTEKQGTDVARFLIEDLKDAAKQPVMTAIVVPSLFPDNAEAGTRESGGNTENRKKGIIPTNRNFPPWWQDLAAAEAAGGGTAKDALGSPILPENLMLIKLMERFHPERIISIHGTWDPGGAGVFYDRRSLRPDEKEAAGRVHPRSPRPQDDEGAGEAEQSEVRKALSAEMLAQADRTDRDLSLNAAKQIDTDPKLKSIKGREGRGLSGNKADHPSIAGNVGPKGKIDNPFWGGGTAGGISLGGYAPARGMSVFTVEPPVDAPSSAYPNAKDEISGKTDKLTQADRITELKAYANAVRTILLGT